MQGSLIDVVSELKYSGVRYVQCVISQDVSVKRLSDPIAPLQSCWSVQKNVILLLIVMACMNPNRLQPSKGFQVHFFLNKDLSVKPGSLSKCAVFLYFGQLPQGQLKEMSFNCKS